MCNGFRDKLNKFNGCTENQGGWQEAEWAGWDEWNVVGEVGNGQSGPGKCVETGSAPIWLPEVVPLISDVQL